MGIIIFIAGMIAGAILLFVASWIKVTNTVAKRLRENNIDNDLNFD